jgi:hypothetical protein
MKVNNYLSNQFIDSIDCNESTKKQIRVKNENQTYRYVTLSINSFTDLYFDIHDLLPSNVSALYVNTLWGQGTGDFW